MLENVAGNTCSDQVMVLQEKATSAAINPSQQPWWFQTVCHLVLHDGKHNVCEILRNIS